jgi:hypothetical protein
MALGYSPAATGGTRCGERVESYPPRSIRLVSTVPYSRRLWWWSGYLAADEREDAEAVLSIKVSVDLDDSKQLIAAEDFLRSHPFALKKGFHLRAGLQSQLS